MQRAKKFKHNISMTSQTYKIIIFTYYKSSKFHINVHTMKILESIFAHGQFVFESIQNESSMAKLADEFLLSGDCIAM